MRHPRHAVPRRWPWSGRCHFPRAGLELRDLAKQFEQRADYLDDVVEQRSVVPDIRWIQFDLADKEVSALRTLLADAVEYNHFPLSLRILALRCILAKFGPLATAADDQEFLVRCD